MLNPRPDAPAAAAKPSLRSRLARHVLLPLALTWGLGSVIVLTVGEHFAAQAFDRALLDDAYALASHVRIENGRVSLHLTPQETGTLLFDHTESVYFAVWAADGSLVSGHGDLPARRVPPGATYDFADLPLEKTWVRSVTLVRDDPAPFSVVMAQTTASRTELLQRLLIYSGLGQLWLLLVLAWWLNRVIERDLQPLAQLQQAVERRDAADLAPLPAAVTQEASTRDVQRLAEALNSLLARLGQSLDAQRQFAGNVAHELRTPLAGIRAQASYALAQGDAAVWRAELEGIVQAEGRASRLVDQLLALARAGEGSTGLQMETIALNELVRDAVLRFLPKADSLGVDLGGEGLDDRVDVRGDQALIEGILNNLLDNALRYGRGSEARVTVAVERKGDAVEMTVTDTGPGLGKRPPDQLTQRWTQGTEGQALGQGAGLGLAIVRRYAELLGAQLILQPGIEGRGLRAGVRFEGLDQGAG